MQCANHFEPGSHMLGNKRERGTYGDILRSWLETRFFCGTLSDFEPCISVFFNQSEKHVVCCNSSPNVDTHATHWAIPWDTSLQAQQMLEFPMELKSIREACQLVHVGTGPAGSHLV